MFIISYEGPEVPESLKEIIFKPFISFGTDKQSRSWLGLSIAIEILQAFKGGIWAEDNIPTGAKFKFKLPVLAN